MLEIWKKDYTEKYEQRPNEKEGRVENMGYIMGYILYIYIKK